MEYVKTHLNQYKLYIILLLLDLFVLLLLFFLQLIPYSELKIIFEIQFLILVVFSLFLYRKITSSNFSIYSLYLCLFCLFLGTRPVLDLFSYENIRELTFYAPMLLDYITTNRMLLNLNIALLSFNIGVIIHYLLKKTNRFECHEISIIHNSKLDNRSKLYWLIGIGLFFKLLFSIRIFHLINQYGYLAFFAGEIEINRSFIEWISDSLFSMGFFIYLSTNRKYLKLKSTLIIIYGLLSMCTGQRGFGMLFIVMAFFYMVQNGSIKINVIKLLIFSLSAIALCIGINIWRFNGVLSETNVVDLFLDFLWGQGVSISVLCYSIKFVDSISYGIGDLFANVEYLFDYYINKLSGESMKDISLLVVDEYKQYGNYISYVMNKDAWLSGMGIGGSYIAEFFAVGRECFQCIGGIITGVMFACLRKGLYSSNIFYRIIIFNWLMYFIYIPRDNWSDFLTENWILLFVVFFYSKVYNIF